jgi:hypothetical protein
MISSKVLETIMFKKLVQHLESNNILTTAQFGFRKDVHIDDAVFSLLNNIITLLDQQKHVGGIFCDLTNAFDCVNHNIFLNKLHYYGIRGTCFSWFKSYLENRKQRVCLSPNIYDQETSSNWEVVANGVPRGSILVPLLFIIYLNDLPYGLHQGNKPVIYADDTSVLTLCCSYLNPYCMGRKTAFFFSGHLNLHANQKQESPTGKKIITIKLKKTK